MSVRALRKSFGKTIILDDITFDLAEGESLVLLGASGSGKTTILRIIAGLDVPDSGSVFLHGVDVTELPARERNIGVIFQDYALFPRMTVAQNIGYGLRIRRRSRAEIAETTEHLLRLVRLEEHRDKFPVQLSGGQQQRVAIARALAYKPEVLLFDEPFGALDAQTRVRLRREIRALLAQVNVPAMFITHDQEEALELGDRIAVLNRARIEQCGTPHDIYHAPDSEYVARFLGLANLLPCVVEGDHLRNGNMTFKVPADCAKLREGEQVKLVFRPEDVLLSRTGTLPAECARLGKCHVSQTHFAGACERLALRMEDDMQGLKSEPLHTTDQSGIFAGAAREPILVQRSKTDADREPLVEGDIVTVGLLHYRVLALDPHASGAKL